ncbi:hypothetical protein OAL72_00685 [bacterium]|nr:hypothetical protein [bacterium]
MISIRESLKRIIPPSFRTTLKTAYLGVFDRHSYRAHRDYRYTDEHIKFVHILEAMNYLRVAGAGGRLLPQTFFEFGCHSGRTFSAEINASRYFRMENAEFFAFDSFEGLPQTNETEDGYFQEGTFCTFGQSFFITKVPSTPELN